MVEVVTPPPPAEMQVAALQVPAAKGAAALPKTASDLPLAALLGMLALGCAFIVRSIRVRTL